MGIKISRHFIRQFLLVSRHSILQWKLTHSDLRGGRSPSWPFKWRRLPHLLSTGWSRSENHRNNNIHHKHNHSGHTRWPKAIDTEVDAKQACYNVKEPDEQSIAS